MVFTDPTHSKVKVGDSHLALSITDPSLDSYVLLRFNGPQRIELPVDGQFEFVAQRGCFMPLSDSGPINARYSESGIVLLRQRPLHRGQVLDELVTPHYVPEKIEGEDYVSMAAKTIAKIINKDAFGAVNPFDLMMFISAYIDVYVSYSLVPPGFEDSVASAVGQSQSGQSFSELMKGKFPITTGIEEITDWLGFLETTVLRKEGSVEKKAAEIIQQAKDLELTNSFYLDSGDLAESALETGIAKCVGFAKAYVDIANQLGLYSEERNGLVKSPGGHAWAVSRIAPYGFIEVDPTNNLIGPEFNDDFSYELGKFYNPEKPEVPDVQVVTPNQVPAALRVLRGNGVEGLISRFTRYSGHAENLKLIKKLG